jgi:predicted transcriptional regulator
MTNTQLMRLSFTHRKALKDLSISQRQFELVQSLEGEKITSRELSDKYDICLQNASIQLKALYTKGYLIREKIEDKTGGYLFEYTANPLLFN